MTTRSTFTMFALAATSMLATSVMLSTPAAAADAGAVLAACDRTAGCGYSPDSGGAISGCSRHACFYCPADGKRQCFQVRTVGKTPIKTTVGGIKLPPGGVTPPKGKGGIALVPVVGVKQPGSGGQPVTIFARGGTAGGGHGGRR